MSLWFFRGEDIPKEIIEVKYGDGEWQQYNGLTSSKMQDKHSQGASCDQTPSNSVLDLHLDNTVCEAELRMSEPPDSSETESESSCLDQPRTESDETMQPNDQTLQEETVSELNQLSATSGLGDGSASKQVSSSNDIAPFNLINVVSVTDTDFTALESSLIDMSDPAIYSGQRLKSRDINAMLNAGLCQDMDYDYPVNKWNRKFKRDWYFREMSDGSKLKRSWLTYSKSVDKAFCIPCIAFSGPRGPHTWSSTGFDDWHNGGRDIVNHEGSSEHRQSEIAQLQWRRGMTVDRMMNSTSNSITEDNRKVMECALDCIRYLAGEMIAFWGNTCSEGKFMSLFKLMAKRDAHAAAYLIRMEQEQQDKKKMAVNLISPRNVRLALTTVKKLIVSKIIKQVQQLQKACIIFDSTQDCSKKEASVMLLRYLDTDDSGECTVVERLVEVFTTGETSGSVLNERIMEVMKSIKFDLKWLVGQCYDGAGNMRGRLSGLATLIQQQCSKAVYIWCHAHRLNLVMNSVTSCCSDVKNTLGMLEELYAFMTGHKRNDILLKAQAESDGRKLQLKRVSTTRWNSTEAAVDTILRRYREVLEALEHLSRCVGDSETVTSAIGLKLRLKDFRVIICMHVLKSVYRIIGPASRQLQSIAIDLATAGTLLDDCVKQFSAMRSAADESWEKIYAEAAQFAAANGVSSDLPAQRRRKKKLMDDEVMPDECLMGKERLKVDLFICVLDNVIQQFESRFTAHNINLMKQLAIFTPSSLLSSKYDSVATEDISEICQQYGLDADIVLQELVDFRHTYRLCSVDTVTQQSLTSNTGFC